MLAFVLAKC